MSSSWRVHGKFAHTFSAYAPYFFYFSLFFCRIFLILRIHSSITKGFARAPPPPSTSRGVAEVCAKTDLNKDGLIDNDISGMY